MDRDKYQQFVTFKNSGQKQEATTAVLEFLDSFTADDDRQAWVREFLEAREPRERIRHEIYERVVFPTLHAGYLQGDYWSTLWLAKTIQNVYAATHLHEQLQQKTDHQLLREAFAIEPTPEVQAGLIQTNLRWFQYSQHEWPAGILYGIDGADPEQCEEILQEIGFTRTLDEAGEYKDFLADFERKVLEYRERLRRHADISAED